jgi:hypothetical protein
MAAFLGRSALGYEHRAGEAVIRVWNDTYEQT